MVGSYTSESTETVDIVNECGICAKGTIKMFFFNSVIITKTILNKHKTLQTFIMKLQFFFNVSSYELI
jgi:hypothetical protein